LVSAALYLQGFFYASEISIYPCTVEKIDMNTELSKPFNGYNRIIGMELIKLTAKREK
jgi:hypothetical protein